MDTICIQRPDNGHTHLRQEHLLDVVFRFTARVFGRAVAMPNLEPPLTTPQKVEAYYWILKRKGERYGFEPLVPLYLTNETTPKMIYTAYALKVKICKLYPAGVTTNSQKGVGNIETIFPALDIMEKLGMILSIHAEKPGVNCMDAECAFLPTFWQIYQAFPKLKIIWEHVTTKEMVDLLERYPDRVGATITAHHLCLTIDDALENPHNYCKPVAKRPEDRDALLCAATSGNPKFFFGSDSAPHIRRHKENGSPRAGVFSDPVALQLLAQIFEEQGALDKLKDFTSRFWAEYCGLSLNKDRITLVKEPWEVPCLYSGLRPFMAGKTINWQISK